MPCFAVYYYNLSGCEFSNNYYDWSYKRIKCKYLPLKELDTFVTNVASNGGIIENIVIIDTKL